MLQIHVFEGNERKVIPNYEYRASAAPNVGDELSIKKSSHFDDFTVHRVCWRIETRRTEDDLVTVEVYVRQRGL